jgi:hypothetical protein
MNSASALRIVSITNGSVDAERSSMTSVVTESQ